MENYFAAEIPIKKYVLCKREDYEEFNYQFSIIHSQLN